MRVICRQIQWVPWGTERKESTSNFKGRTPISSSCSQALFVFSPLVLNVCNIDCLFHPVDSRMSYFVSELSLFCAYCVYFVHFELYTTRWKGQGHALNVCVAFKIPRLELPHTRDLVNSPGGMDTDGESTHFLLGWTARRLRDKRQMLSNETTTMC